MRNPRLEAKTPSGVVQFDIDDVVGIGPEQVSRRGEGAVAELDGSLQEALASARPAAEAVIDAFRGLEPGEIDVEFGLRIDAQAGAVFVKAGVGAHFTVRLKWTPSGEHGSTSPAPSS